MQTRESNRDRKYKQVQQDAIVDAELSLRWWRLHNYHHYIPLVLQYNVPPHLLEAREQTFIQHFQPKLNFPYIKPHMKRAFRGISQPSHKLGARSGLKSIWAKLRRRHLPRNIAPLHKSPTFQRQSQVWRTLCDLASNTRRRFDSIRELLRRHTPSSQLYAILYAMHKLSHNLPPPHHLPAGKAVATAMRKRKLPIPSSRLPISIPFLSHPSQLSDTREFLR